jgi:hypothetical protein
MKRQIEVEQSVFVVRCGSMLSKKGLEKPSEQ